MGYWWLIPAGLTALEAYGTYKKWKETGRFPWLEAGVTLLTAIPAVQGFRAWKAARAAAAGLKGLSLPRTLGPVAEMTAAQIEQLQAELAAARAAGDVKQIARLESQLRRYLDIQANLAMSAQIAQERKWWLATQIPGLLLWGAFTYEEGWRQPGEFRENILLQAQLKEPQLRLQQQWLQLMAQRTELMKQQMAAEERNRAFWAWYMQQKLALEQMRQQAELMKAQLAAARRQAGDKVAEYAAKERFMQVVAWYQAVKQAWKAWQEWQKAYAAMTRKWTEAQLQERLLTLRGKWDAFLTAMKSAYRQAEEVLKSQLERQEIAARAQWEMAKTAFETQAEMMREAWETQLKAALERVKAQAEIAKERAKAEAMRKLIIEKALWDRIDEIGKMVKELAVKDEAALHDAVKAAIEAAKKGQEFKVAIPVWTPTGWRVATVTATPKAVRVDLTKKAEQIALQYNQMVFWKPTV